MSSRGTQGARATVAARLRQTLERVELTSIGYTHEVATVISPAGDAIWDKHGSDHNVDFTEAEAAGTAGMIFTHNHPSGMSFSEEDIRFASYWHVAEMRAVGSQYRYSMRPPAGAGWTNAYWRATVEPAIATHNAQLRTEIVPRIQSGELSIDEANMLHQHELWVRVAAATGLRYKRTPW